MRVSSSEQSTVQRGRGHGICGQFSGTVLREPASIHLLLCHCSYDDTYLPFTTFDEAVTMYVVTLHWLFYILGWGNRDNRARPSCASITAVIFIPEIKISTAHMY